ncbi:hypothetical protein PAERUG_P54_1_London_24_VIM_2_04_13_01247 [Pseudomonas aeruginosa]|nr:hypothetical protein PAERUG_E16_London_17_VIM_2_04_14_03194 [Pseudomonas aeruginosa]CRW97645.1 hypothetical protein PAERUG_P54_1_London_24_VIM_2_04_13_01247 [Pseudomonas aeruginosa]
MALHGEVGVQQRLWQLGTERLVALQAVERIAEGRRQGLDAAGLALFVAEAVRIDIGQGAQRQASFDAQAAGDQHRGHRQVRTGGGVHRPEFQVVLLAQRLAADAHHRADAQRRFAVAQSQAGVGGAPVVGFQAQVGGGGRRGQRAQRWQVREHAGGPVLAEFGEIVGSTGLVQQRAAVGMLQAQVQVHPVGHRAGCRQRCEAGTQAHLPRHFASDLADVHRAVGGGHALRRAAGDLVLALAVFGEEHLRLGASLGQGADQPAGELPGGTLGLQRKRRGRTLTGQAEQAEFVFERRDDLQAAVAIAFHLGPQQAARAGRPRRAVGFHQVAVQVVERRRSGVGTLLDAHPAVRVGQQAQVAVAAPGAALVDQVLGGQRAVRRYPAATAGQLLLQGRQGQRTPAGDAGQVGGDEADQAYRLQAVHRLLRPRAAMRCRTVSVSLIQQ